MCLHLKKGTRAKIAKEDIVVYKCLEMEDGKYITPYMHFNVEMGKTYSSELTKFKATPIFKYDTFDCYADVFQGLHTFVNYDETKRFCQLHNRILVKCIIPKGSTYYVGIFADIAACASDKLTYVEIIE